MSDTIFRSARRSYETMSILGLFEVVAHLFILFASDLSRRITPLEHSERRFMPQGPLGSTHRSNQENHTGNHNAPEGEHDQASESHTEPPHPAMTAHHARPERPSAGLV